MAAKKRRKAAPRKAAPRKAAPRAAAPRRTVRRRRSAPQTTALAPRRRSGPSPALVAANDKAEKATKAKNAAVARARDAEDALPIVEHVVAAPSGFLGGLAVQKFVSSRAKKNAEKVAAGTALTKTDERMANPETVGSVGAAIVSGLGLAAFKFLPRGVVRKAFSGAALGASSGAMGAVGYTYAARKEAEKAAAGTDPNTAGPGAGPGPEAFMAADQLLAQMRMQLPAPRANTGGGARSIVGSPASNRRAF